MRLDPEEPFRFIGCLSVFPVASVGTFMILDYPGPQGPFGFAEYFGWWTLCIVIGLLTGKLIAGFYERTRWRWLRLLGGLMLPTALTLLFWEDIKPTTPPEVKSAVEVALRGVGLLAIVTLIIVGGRSWWKSRSPRSSD